MADASIGPAVIGLIGVLVGSGISTGASWLLAHRKEKADAAKEEAARLREIKRAARLVEAELAWARALLRFSLEEERMPSDLVRPSTDAWDAHKAVLAVELTEAEWLNVRQGIVSVQALISNLDKPDWQTAAFPNQGVETAIKAIDGAAKTLKRYAE